MSWDRWCALLRLYTYTYIPLQASGTEAVLESLRPTWLHIQAAVPHDRDLPPRPGDLSLRNSNRLKSNSGSAQGTP